MTNPFQMLQGQALIGGGSVVPLTGVKTGKTVDFAFDGTRPTLVGNNSAIASRHSIFAATAARGRR